MIHKAPILGAFFGASLSNTSKLALFDCLDSSQGFFPFFITGKNPFIKTTNVLFFSIFIVPFFVQQI